MDDEEPQAGTTRGRIRIGESRQGEVDPRAVLLPVDRPIAVAHGVALEPMAGVLDDPVEGCVAGGEPRIVQSGHGEESGCPVLPGSKNGSVVATMRRKMATQSPKCDSTDVDRPRRLFVFVLDKKFFR
jgi:hypothetical protein